MYIRSLKRVVDIICVYIHARTQNRSANPPAPNPVTPVGAYLSFVSPVPSCPLLFQPQQSTLPPVSSTHVCPYPGARATTPARRAGADASACREGGERGEEREREKEYSKV